MAQVLLDIPLFRAQFCAFKDQGLYPDSCITVNWDMATCYFQDNNPCFTDSCTRLILNSLTAHLLELNNIITSGESVGVVTSATIDKVTVTLAPPPGEDQWDRRLSSTPYGAQAQALMQGQGAGGYMVYGTPNNSAFRKLGGVF